MSNTTSRFRKEEHPKCCQPLIAIYKEGLIIMASDKHGMKDKIAGKLKETEGKVTNDKTREGEGKLQKLKGKVKDEINDLKESIKGNKKEG